MCEGLINVKYLSVLFFQHLSFAAAVLVVLQHLDLWGVTPHPSQIVVFCLFLRVLYYNDDTFFYYGDYNFSLMCGISK